MEKLYHKKLSKEFGVSVHKVNQSGASSKEVGDIDIFKVGKFHYAIEVKDKKFTPYDLEHAFRKIQANGGKKGQFIFGPNATYDVPLVDKRISEFEKEDFIVLLQDIFSYARIMIFKIDLNNKQEFIDSIVETAIDINSKEEVKSWIQTLLKFLSWK